MYNSNVKNPIFCKITGLVEESQVKFHYEFDVSRCLGPTLYCFKDKNEKNQKKYKFIIHGLLTLMNHKSKQITIFLICAQL